MSILCKTPSIRDVIAFPKTGSGTDPLFASPAPARLDVLDQRGIGESGLGGALKNASVREGAKADTIISTDSDDQGRTGTTMVKTRIGSIPKGSSSQ